MSETRYAFVLVKADTGYDYEGRIQAYMPGNYQVTGIGPAPEGERFLRVHIAGQDRQGWTLDEYVIPRLASGLYGCTECDENGELIVAQR